MFLIKEVERSTVLFDVLINKFVLLVELKINCAVALATELWHFWELIGEEASTAGLFPLELIQILFVFGKYGLNLISTFKATETIVLTWWHKELKLIISLSVFHHDFIGSISLLKNVLLLSLLSHDIISVQGK